MTNYQWKTNNGLFTFYRAYIEAMFFTECNSDSELGADCDERDLNEDTLKDIQADCRSFYRRFGPFIQAEVCFEAFNDPVAQAGHDFYFTRNRDGVGFWEDEWPECYRDILTKGAESYGETSLYMGDDSELYID